MLDKEREKSEGGHSLQSADWCLRVVPAEGGGLWRGGPRPAGWVICP